MVKRVARFGCVVLVNGREHFLTGAPGEQLLANARHGPECLPSGLEGKRNGDVGPAAAGDRVQGIELERREVVEPVDEKRGGTPGLRMLPERIERPPGIQLGIGQPGSVDRAAIAAIDGRDLLGVGAPGPRPGPVAQRAREPRGIDHRAFELRDEASRGADESGLPGGLGEDGQLGAAYRFLCDQLALELGRRARTVTGPAGDLLEQPAEAQHARTEDGTPLGQLTLGVLHVAEGGHDENRLFVEARPEATQHCAGLGGVGGAGDER